MATLREQVKGQLEELQVGQSFNKKEFVKATWGNSEEFTIRSFDVYFCLVKKELRPKEFRTLGGNIRRNF